MIDFAVRRPAVMWACCIALLVAGAVAFLRLPLATRTAVELPQLSVYAGWYGASPEVVETYLTSPIEAAVQSVRGVARIESTSSDGSAMLSVELEPRADVQMVRLEILERLELLRPELPPGVMPPRVANDVPEGLEEEPLLSLTASGPYTPAALQRLLEERVNPRLAAVPGVAGVQARGGTLLGVSVSYDDVLLRRLGIAPSLLAAAVRDARLLQQLGEQRRGSTVRYVVLRDGPSTIDALRALPIRGPGGRVFRLGELASVRAEEDAQGTFFRLDGRPAVSLDVSRHPGADAIRTAAAVRAALAEAQEALPPALALRVTSDESEDLAAELRDLAVRGALALGAVVVVLVVMLRRWRPVALVMGTTLVAIAATALTLFVFRVPANMLTLAGLGMGVGILVQNGLVVVQRLGTQPDTPEGRASAARRITPAVVGSTLATGVVLFPFLYLQGNARAAFVPFALAFVIALAWSVVTAVLVVPALGAGAGVRHVRWHRTRHVYAALLGCMLRWRPATLALTLGVLGVMTWAFVEKVPRSSFGGYGSGRTLLTVSLGFPRGSEPATLDAAMRDFERIVLGRPEIDQVRTQAWSPTRAQMSVRFTKEGAFTAAPMELQETLTQRAVLVGGASVGVHGTGPGFSAGNMGSSFQSFRLRVLGYSYDGVARVTEDLARRLDRITRVTDIRVTSGGYFGNERGYQVTLEPNRATMARYGVTASDLVAAIGRETRGQSGRELLELGGEELPVTVKSAGARERSLDELGAAIVPVASGAPVRIGDVSVVSEREAMSSVVREDQQYRGQVSYDFRGPPKLARRTHDAFMKSLAAPAGFSIVDLTDDTGVRDDESARGLWMVFAVGIALVILAVALVFDSVWGSAMVLLSLPLCLAGVVAAFWYTGAAFTREAAVGVILVLGLAVNHAILLVDAALERRRERQDAGAGSGLPAGAVLRASLDRAGMIFFVTLASLASLAPLSLGTNASSLFGAIALATAGGTVAGTLGALLVLPVMLAGLWKRNSAAPTAPTASTVPTAPTVPKPFPDASSTGHS